MSEKDKATKTSFLRAGLVDAKEETAGIRDQLSDVNQKLFDVQADLYGQQIDQLKAENESIRDDRDTQVAGHKSDKDKIGKQFRWLLYIVMAEHLLIVIMLGVATNVIQDGEIDVPLLGTVNVGQSEIPDEKSAPAIKKSKAKARTPDEEVLDTSI